MCYWISVKYFRFVAEVVTFSHFFSDVNIWATHLAPHTRFQVPNSNFNSRYQFFTTRRVIYVFNDSENNRFFSNFQNLWSASILTQDKFLTITTTRRLKFGTCLTINGEWIVFCSVYFNAYYTTDSKNCRARNDFINNYSV